MMEQFKLNNDKKNDSRESSFKDRVRRIAKITTFILAGLLSNKSNAQVPKERAPKVYTNKDEYNKAKQAYDDSMVLYKLNQGKSFDQKYNRTRNTLNPSITTYHDSGYVEEVEIGSGSDYDVNQENKPGFKGSKVEYSITKEPLGTDWRGKPEENIKDVLQDRRKLDLSNRRLYKIQEKEIKRAIDEWNKSNDKKLGALMRKYKPIAYLNKIEYSEGYLTHTYARKEAIRKYIKPETYVMEDQTNRAELKKIYPELTDKDIDEAVQERRERNNFNYIKKGVGVDDKSWEEDPYENFTSDSLQGYRPESIVNDINRYTSSLPIWKRPVQPVEFQPQVERVGLGTFNIHGREFKYYSPMQKNDILNKLESHHIEVNKVGATENYTVTRFQEKTKGWQGNKLLDEKGEVLIDLDIINQYETPQMVNSTQLDIALEGQGFNNQKGGLIEKKFDKEKAPTFREWFIHNHLDPKVLSNASDLAKAQEIYDKEYPNNLTKNDKSKAFLANWYKNRRISDPDLQEAFEKDRSEYLKRIKNLPNYNYVQSINAPGFDSKNIRGQYDESTDEVSIRNFSPEYVKTHELDHFIRAGKISEGLDKYLLKNIDFLSNKDKFYEYVYDPEEMHARIMVLREVAGIDPKQVVDEKFLYDFIQKYKNQPSNSNINILLKYLKFEDLLYLLNDMVSNEKPKKVGESKVYEG